MTRTRPGQVPNSAFDLDVVAMSHILVVTTCQLSLSMQVDKGHETQSKVSIDTLGGAF